MTVMARSPARGDVAAARLLRRVEALRRSQPRRALRAVDRGFARATRSSTPRRRGELWRVRAHVLRSLRRTAEAVAAYRAADHWFARAGEAHERGRCAIGLIDALMYLGRYEEAQSVANQGRRLLGSSADPATLARLCNNEANLHHRIDHPERALAGYRHSRRFFLRSGDARSAAVVAINVANCLALLGRCDQATRLYRSARDELRSAGMTFDALNAEYNLAYVGFLEHRYEEALADLALVSSRAQDRGFPSFVALAALDRAEILLRLEAHEEALLEAAKAEAACRELGLAYEHAKALTFGALAEHRLERRAAARARLARALVVFRAEGNDVWMGEGLMGLATVWYRDGNPRAAAALLAVARRRFRRAGDREREACCLALLARLWLQCGERTRAQSCLDDLQPVARRRASPRLRHLALAAEAALARSHGDGGRAQRLLRRAAAGAERLAARILDEHWRASFWGEWGWPHVELMALELSDGKATAAFEALERGRGRALVGSSARARRTATASLPVSVRRWAASRMARDRLRSGRSRRALAATEGSNGSLPPPPGIEQRLQTFPALAVRADAVRRSLPAGMLLADFWTHGGRVGAFRVRREGVDSVGDLADQRKLSELVQALLFELRGAAFTPHAERKFGSPLRDRLAELAALVLWPLLGRSAESSAPRALAIVPTGPLARLPWAALPLPDGRPLFEATELRIVPGLRLGLLGRHRSNAAAGAGEPPLIVASDAGELEGVARETRSLLEWFPEARLLGAHDASAQRFLELAPGAAWIHFAGHGLYRAEAPHESALRFADRWLPAAELAQLRLRARWVALSACQTARALVRPGDEWFGLSRELLLGGAGAVLAAQWDVEDVPTAHLMADVYREVAGGSSLSRALAAAQSTRSRAGVHPFNWAGFVVLGLPPRRSIS